MPLLRFSEAPFKIPLHLNAMKQVPHGDHAARVFYPFAYGFSFPKRLIQRPGFRGRYRIFQRPPAREAAANGVLNNLAARIFAPLPNGLELTECLDKPGVLL